MTRWIAAAVLSLAALIAACGFAGWMLIPPRGGYGATWEMYRQEPKDSVDVLFFGSSIAYCDVVPGVIWADSGVTSYVMAGPEQTLPISFDYIKEACRTQSPKVIALEMNGMFFPRYQNYTKANIAYMPWSVNRLEAIIHGAEPELRAGLLFPILDYHSRWQETESAEWEAHLAPDTDEFAGYTFLDTVSPQAKITYRDYVAGDENYLRNLKYLRKIEGYCRENHIELLLFLSPAMGRVPEEALARLKEDVSQLSARFVDFNEIAWALAIDNGTDWHDFLHFNCRGAEKFSHYLAAYLTEEFGLTPTEGEDEALWQARAEEFTARWEAAAAKQD